MRQQHDLYVVVPQMIVAGYLSYICVLKLSFGGISWLQRCWASPGLSYIDRVLQCHCSEHLHSVKVLLAILIVERRLSVHKTL